MTTPAASTPSTPAVSAPAPTPAVAAPAIPAPAAAAPVQPAAPRATIGQRLTAAAAALQSGANFQLQISELRAAADAANTENTRLAAELATASSGAATLQAQVNTLTQERDAARTELEQVRGALPAQVSTGVINALDQIGIPAASVPAPTPEGEGAQPSTAAEFVKAIGDAKDPVQKKKLYDAYAAQYLDAPSAAAARRN